MTGNSKYRRLCIVTAVDIEFNTATGLLSQKSFSEDSRICRGTHRDRQITVLKSGMGALGFARLWEHHLRDSAYDAVIVAGLGGGLDPKLKAADAVVYNLCRDARTPISKEIESDRDEFARIVSDHGLSNFVFESLRASGISSTLGHGITVNRIVTTSEEKLAIGVRYNAQAVDMETFEVGVVCKDSGAPMTALRIVLDDAHMEIPDFNRAYGEDGRVIPARMAAVMLAKPAVTARFLYSLRAAVKSLQKSLKAVYEAKSVWAEPNVSIY